MDLLDEESHRLLLWAVRLGEVGATPTEKELQQLAEPRGRVAGNIIEGLAGHDLDFAESAADALIRRGLLHADNNERLHATDLGKLVIAAMEFHPADSPLFEVLETDLRSSDVLGFARIVGRIATLHRPMIVDPYCDREQLEYVAAHTTVTRVLVSDRLSDDDLTEIAEFVDSIEGRNQRLRVRVAPASHIHDRHVISDDRVFMVSNLHYHNNVASTVITEPLDLSDSIRAHYRHVWKCAAKLAAYRPESGAKKKSAALEKPKVTLSTGSKKSVEAAKSSHKKSKKNKK